MMGQGEFNFETGAGEWGHQRWLAGRKAAARQLARQVNLPVGHEIEVSLVGGIRLRGHMRLKESMLLVEEERARYPEFVVDHVSSTYGEIESGVRVD